jgi:hypothetical protein
MQHVAFFKIDFFQFQPLILGCLLSSFGLFNLLLILGLPWYHDQNANLAY